MGTDQAEEWEQEIRGAALLCLVWYEVCSLTHLQPGMQSTAWRGCGKDPRTRERGRGALACLTQTPCLGLRAIREAGFLLTPGELNTRQVDRENPCHVTPHSLSPNFDRCDLNSKTLGLKFSPQVNLLFLARLASGQGCPEHFRPALLCHPHTRPECLCQALPAQEALSRGPNSHSADRYGVDPPLCASSGATLNATHALGST